MIDNSRQPSPRLQRIIRLLEFLPKVFALYGAWLVVPLMLALVYEVISRYIFNKPTSWAYDLTYMLSTAVFMLGVAYALQKGLHVRVDFLLARARPRYQALVDALLYVILFFPSMAIFLVISYQFAAKSWRQLETYPQSPWMPPIYPLKSLIPLVVTLLLIQGIAELIKCIWTIRNDTPYDNKELTS